MPTSLQNRIAEQRKARRMTQEQLARALGVSQPRLSQWESGTKRVLWMGKPHVSRAPLGDVDYRLTTERLIISGGLLGRSKNQVELLSVKAIRVIQGLPDHAFGMTRIDIVSTDASTPALTLSLDSSVADDVNSMIRNAVMEARHRAGA